MTTEPWRGLGQKVLTKPEDLGSLEGVRELQVNNPPKLASGIDVPVGTAMGIGESFSVHLVI